MVGHDAEHTGWGYTSSWPGCARTRVAQRQVEEGTRRRNILSSRFSLGQQVLHPFGLPGQSGEVRLGFAHESISLLARAASDLYGALLSGAWAALFAAGSARVPGWGPGDSVVAAIEVCLSARDRGRAFHHVTRCAGLCQ